MYSPARPSSSVVVISSDHQVLLLHRVQTSTSFASAHVFPGGNLDDFHDGPVPANDDASRHEDGLAYRLAAIRETFEESGILLTTNVGAEHDEDLDLTEREEGRHLVHTKQIKFLDWLSKKHLKPDTANLIPFTRWITPARLPKRYTTQMYLYLLPLRPDHKSTDIKSTTPVPLHDGGLEITAAQFLPPRQWLDLANDGSIILFPPQFFILHLLATHLPSQETNYATNQAQRERFLWFVASSDPPWGEKCISPTRIGEIRADGRQVLDLSKPGPELEKSEKRGETDLTLLVEFAKEGPRRLEVRNRGEAFCEDGVEDVYRPHKL